MKFTYLLFFIFFLSTQMVAQENSSENKTSEVEYIKFQLQNNSIKRVHAYVKGPKEKPFSYGFPLNPGAKRPENWPVGTKVYLERNIGANKYLITIKAEDENQVVKLFQR